MKKALLTLFATSCILFAFTKQVFAHEAYVLTQETFSQGLKIYAKNPFDPLISRQYLGAFLLITVIVAFSYATVLFWSTTKLSGKLDKILRKANLFGPLIIRLAISASFFFAAEANVILGPELPLNNMPYGAFIRYIEFLLSLMIFFGFYVEVMGLISLLIFCYITTLNGAYMITYANYFGEIIVLMLFGSRFFSLDYLIRGKNLLFKKLEKYAYFEVPLVRVLYGIALIYAGYTIKFQHQYLTVEVYNQYHLEKFFHASGQFIAAGAGLSEIMIGLFILLGFMMRFTILISLVFITLSLLYFHEMLWPHLMLFGISFSLIINSGDQFTIDRYLIPFTKKILKVIFK